MSNLKNKDQYPGMVKWFSLAVLMKAAKRAIISAIFGAYADRRLTHAALDNDHKSTPIDLSKKIPKGDEIWIDYVADLGDGFDSTYTIAYLLGQSKLEIGGHTLPRGNVLIMGGDQVYPTPSREEYERRFERPYSYAFPYTKEESSKADHPYVFLLPGNHDWYDGLTLFLAKFCNGETKPNYKYEDESKYNHLGSTSWRLAQHRSYFAIKLSEDWWIWGIDSQLDQDIDKPQHEYFNAIASTNKCPKNIIICASTPSWLKVNSKHKEEQKYFSRTIDHIASAIIKVHWEEAKINVVISGDLHHYSRYMGESSKTAFITSGGGGAFLHPTHQLEEDIVNICWLRRNETLKMAKSSHDSSNENFACYPQQKTSRLLSIWNLLFPFKNITFSFIIGIIYTIFVTNLLTFNGTDSTLICDIFSPIFIIQFTILVFILYFYALNDDVSKSKSQKAIYGIIHSIAHMSCILYIKFSLYSNISLWLTNRNIDCNIISNECIHKAYIFGLVIIALIILPGLLGGFLWGVYLAISSAIFNNHSNDAFSAIRHPGYKNFLRMRIKDDSWTIFPIGIKKVPSRSKWKFNPLASRGKQNEPKVIPTVGINEFLIEDPIEIKLDTR